MPTIKGKPGTRKDAAALRHPQLIIRSPVSFKFFKPLTANRNHLPWVGARLRRVRSPSSVRITGQPARPSNLRPPTDVMAITSLPTAAGRADHR